MPRPKNKCELQDLSQKNYQRLLDLVESFSNEELTLEFPENFMNKNPRDVLSHLHQWHLMMLDWYKVGMSGNKPKMPAEGYTWKTTKELNYKIWQDYQNISLAQAKSLLAESHQKIQSLIEKHSDEELFTKKYYHWTGSTSLAAYLIGSSSSHYDWAYKLIKKARNSLS